MPIKLTLTDIQKFLDENDVSHSCTLLSTEYINSSSPLRFWCNKCDSNEFQRDWAHLKRGRFTCEACSKAAAKPSNALTISDIQDYIKKHDVNNECYLVSTEYVNNKTPLEFHCNICNRNFFRDAGHLFRGRFRCSECGIKAGAKKLQYTDEDVKERLFQDGITMIGNYVNAATGVKCLCSEGHEFDLYFSAYISARGRGCPQCAILKHSGEGHWNYNGGGHQEVIDDLRHVIAPWKKECLQASGYKCDITGSSSDLVVHHLKNFREIVDTALDNTKLPLYNYISEYTNKERQTLEQEVLRLHSLEDGVVLSRELHDEFHKIYGKVKNTRDQYKEFKMQKKLK